MCMTGMAVMMVHFDLANVLFVYKSILVGAIGIARLVSLPKWRDVAANERAKKNEFATLTKQIGEEKSNDE